MLVTDLGDFLDELLLRIDFCHQIIRTKTRQGQDTDSADRRRPHRFSSSIGSFIFDKPRKFFQYQFGNGNILKNFAENSTRNQPPVNPKFKNKEFHVEENLNDKDSIYEIYDDTYEEPYALILKK